MQDEIDMKAIEIDALTEAGNIGAGHAATSLSKLLREHIMNSTSSSSIVSIDQVPEALGGAEKPVAGIYTRLSGDMTGGLLMLFPEKSAKILIRLLSDSELRDFELTDFQGSLISEVGNICLCWYLSAISKMTGLDMIPSPPVAAYDMAGAVIDLPLIELGKVADTAVLIQTKFKGEIHEIEGVFLLLPDPESLKIILERLGVA